MFPLCGTRPEYAARTKPIHFIFWENNPFFGNIPRHASQNDQEKRM